MVYDFKKIEAKWQKIWQKNKEFEVENPNYFVLSMWPYPSGKLHMGHLRNYLIGDVIARFKTMKGLKVLHPMGWDAFGLPAENAAIEGGLHPKKWTLENINSMKEALDKIGFSFNWAREETSCLPEYYKHEQKMFLEFLKHDIAYKKDSIVNWDPVDNTVLANEQVIDGKGWRSGAIVEKRFLSQWFLRISDFSKELLEDLKTLTKWPEKVRLMQENWIGLSKGAEIDFEVKNSQAKIKVFTTRPDTLFGASFIAISYAHPFALQIKEAKDFIEQCKLGSAKAEDIETAEKLGFFTKSYCINPVNGELLPIYIANFVLMDYGTGALFGCPAHDTRDFEFAIKYSLPIKQVVHSSYPKVLSEFNLETERCIIRPFKEEDLSSLTAVLLELNQNPNWIDSPKAETEVIKEAREKLERFMLWQKQYGFSRFAVFKKDTGEFMGGAGFCHPSLEDRDYAEGLRETDLELGYWFFEKFHGNRYASEVLDSLLQYASQNLPYLRVIAITNPQNESSKKLLLKFGFNKILEGKECIFEKKLEPQLKEPFLGEGHLYYSDFLNGLSSAEAKEKMLSKFTEKTNFRLKDWGVSRQRYWGCPIPVINCKKCGIVPVPEAELPVTLPEDIKLEVGQNPLRTHPTWRFVKCPCCKGDADRETDTLDTFFESSWYFLRFSGKGGEAAAFKAPLVVNDYIGGVEHAILHLLYARFFTRALKKVGYPVGFTEPFERLITQGMVCHKTYQTLEGKWLTPGEAAKMPEDLVKIGPSIKMSKSKKNVVEPAEIVEKFGADTARFFIASDTPPERDMDWSDDGVLASHKFLNKFFAYCISLKDLEDAKDPFEGRKEEKKHFFKALKGYFEDLEHAVLNKAIARIREMFNIAYSSDSKALSKHIIKNVLACLLPFAPHIASELWQNIGFEGKISSFLPSVEEFEDETYKISVQVNGKLRGVIEIAKDISPELQKEESIKEAYKNASISKHLESKKIIKEVYVAGKILSFVTE